MRGIDPRLLQLGSVGTDNNPVATITTDRILITERTSDPSNPEVGECWIRIDTSPPQLRYYDGSSVGKVPLQDPGDVSTGYTPLTVETSLGQKAIALDQLGSADHPNMAVDTPEGGLAMTGTSIIGTVVWETAADWDNASSDDGVVHQSVTNTDHDDASILKQGYDYASFSEITADPDLAWPFHEDSGSTAHDLSATTYDGSINGASIGQSGILGTTAFDFSSGGYVSAGDQDLLSGAGTFSAGAWVKFSSLSSKGYIFAKVSDSDFNTFHLSINSSGELEFYTQVNSSNYTLTANPSLSTGVWYLIYATFDGSLSIWVDTIREAGPMNAGGGNMDDTTAPLTVGGSDLGDSLAGTIADPRFYRGENIGLQPMYDIVRTAGTLTTQWKSLDAAATQLQTDSTIPANTRIDITVEQDTNSDGIPENSQTVTLSGGTGETNSLSGFSDTSGQYRIDISLNNSDTESASLLNSAEIVASG